MLRGVMFSVRRSVWRRWARVTCPSAWSAINHRTCLLAVNHRTSHSRCPRRPAISRAPPFSRPRTSPSCERGSFWLGRHHETELISLFAHRGTARDVSNSRLGTREASHANSEKGAARYEIFFKLCTHICHFPPMEGDEGCGLLISSDGVASCQIVGVSASDISPCTIKSRKFLLAAAQPGCPAKGP